MTRWRESSGVAGRRDPGPTGRHPGDVLRVALGVVVLAVSVLPVQRDNLTTFERNLFRLLNDLPPDLAVLLGPLMELGNVAAAPAVGLVALLATRRHVRVAVDVTVAGFAAWWAAKVVKDVVERPRPVGFVVDADRLVDSGLGFVSGHTAVAAAIVTAASPYLPRPLRRAVWALPWIVGLARVFYGAHLPLDIVGGAALGWAVGAGIHVLAGAPHRRPTLADAAVVMGRSGGGPWVVGRVPGEGKGSFPFVADDGTRTLFVKLLDPEPRDRDWLYRLGRFVAFRDIRDEVAIADSRSRADHEAALALLARSRGARTPEVHAIEIEGKQVWIIQEHLDAAPIDEVSTDDLSDEVLDELWGQVALLWQAGIAHRDLVAANILIDRQHRPWLVNFAHARTTHGRHAFDNDVAEMLVTTASVVGPRRAVARAHQVLGAAAVGRALPELQPLALTAEARRRLRLDEGLLDALRREVAAAAELDLTGIPPPVVDLGHRTALALGAVGAVGGLVTVAGPRAVVGSLEGDAWRWLGLATVAAVVAIVASAVTLLAAIDRRLAIGRTVLLRLAEVGTEILQGRRSGRLVVLGHLERAGVPAAEALSGLSRAARVQRVALLLAGIVSVWAFVASEWSVTSDGEVAGLAAVGVLSGALELGLLRRRARARPVPATAPDAADRPRATLWLAATTQLGASIVATVGVAEAMGGAPHVAGVTVVLVGAAALAMVVPLSVGSGAVTAAVAVGLALLGMPSHAAVATAVVSGALQVWVPGLVGWLARSVGRVPGRPRPR